MTTSTDDEPGSGTAESERLTVHDLVTRSDFRDAVLRIVDQRLEDEVERRAWRRGSEVF